MRLFNRILMMILTGTLSDCAFPSPIIESAKDESGEEANPDIPGTDAGNMEKDGSAPDSV